MAYEISYTILILWTRAGPYMALKTFTFHPKWAFLGEIEHFDPYSIVLSANLSVSKTGLVCYRHVILTTIRYLFKTIDHHSNVYWFLVR